ELHVRVGVPLREPGDVLGVAGEVTPQRERGPVGERDEVVGSDDRDLVAVSLELELLHDPGRHQAHHVARAGDPIARPGLLGDGRAAHDLSALQHQHVEARPGQVRGTCQPVVASADHHHVAFERALVERWDGQLWVVAATPNAGAENVLNAAAAAGPQDVWAVGRASNGAEDIPLIEQWDGIGWNLSSAPAIAGGAALYGVAAAGRTVWAVGASGSADLGTEQALILRW